MKKFLILILSGTLAQVKGDLPIHCLLEKVIGVWNFKITDGFGFESNQLFDSKLDHAGVASEFTLVLRDKSPESHTGILDLSLEAETAQHKFVRTSWTLNYDEGLVVQQIYPEYTLIFYGPFDYNKVEEFEGKSSSVVLPDGSTPGYASDCGKVNRGWVIKKSNHSLSTMYFSAIRISDGESSLSSVDEHTHLDSHLPLEYHSLMHIPSPAVVFIKQGECGSCFVLAFAHAFEVTFARKTIQKNTLSADSPFFVDREAILACSYSSQGCDGGYYQSLILDLLVTGVPQSGCMDKHFEFSSNTIHTAQQCNPSCFENVVPIAGFSELRTQSRVRSWILMHGPVLAAISLPARNQISDQLAQNPDAIIHVENEVHGSWSYVDHGIVLLGWGESAGKFFWEVYNPWGGELSTMRISRSINDGIIEKYALGIRV